MSFSCKKCLTAFAFLILCFVCSTALAQNTDLRENSFSKRQTQNEMGSTDDFSLKTLETKIGSEFFTKSKVKLKRQEFLAEDTLNYRPAKKFKTSQTRKNTLFDDETNDKTKEGFHWRAAIGQSLLLLSIQHGYAFTQPKTREAIKGKFFKDYVNSVKSLHGWDDGGRFFTNYLAHPLQGSLTGFIQIQNDPAGKLQRFGNSKGYWHSRLKALAWTAAWSTQFEIGPVSQASIGNVGLKGKQTYVDLVMTPLGGTAMVITEDALDRFVMERVERRTSNFYIIIFCRMILSPGRTFANILRFKTPWYRDRPRQK